MVAAKTAMRKNTKKRMADEGATGGFTIIEVVLVLAIAGLIFLMVFVAWPQLSRAQRDTQRRQDLGRLTTIIQNYQSNNNGRLPDKGSTKAVDDADTVNWNDKTTNWPCSSGADKNSANCLIRNYINGTTSTRNEFVDPDGTAYGLAIGVYNQDTEVKDAGSGAFDHMVYVVKNARCDGEALVGSSNGRDYAVVYKLEGSGTYCQSNS